MGHHPPNHDLVCFPRKQFQKSVSTIRKALDRAELILDRWELILFEGTGHPTTETDTTQPAVRRRCEKNELSKSERWLKTADSGIDTFHIEQISKSKHRVTINGTCVVLPPQLSLLIGLISGRMNYSEGGTQSRSEYVRIDELRLRLSDGKPFPLSLKAFNNLWWRLTKEIAGAGVLWRLQRDANGSVRLVVKESE